jgi:predicted metalloprotease
MGDGLLDGLAAIGLSDVAPDYVHAHEVAHHVQFEIGAFLPGPPTPEGTRRTELMADAFAAYYSSHARGATFNEKRFVDVMASAFGVGDCSFASPNHHGTHLQRERAAAWGGSIVEGEQEKGHIKSAYEMLWLFDLALPVLVAPDAP